MTSSYAGKPRRGDLRWLWLFLLILSLPSLACLTADVIFRVVPQDADNADVQLTVSQYLTQEYIDAAKQANAELQQDYLSAGREAPDPPFPETYQELAEQGGSMDIPENGSIIEQNDRGYTAQGTMHSTGGQDPNPDDNWTLTSSKDETGWVTYHFEIQVPALSEDLDLTNIDKLRQDGLPPKPPLPPPDEEGEPGDPMAFLAMLGGVEQELDLTGWYGLRILLQTGLPVMSFAVELPGEVTLHTLDGQPAGTLDPQTGQVRLVMDEAYMRQYGSVEHVFTVESRLHPCELTCGEKPNMIWDGEGDGSYCSCICDQGWQPDDQGTCVACDQLCPGWDARAVYDPDNSQPNVCACRCDEKLMQWDSGNDRCRCVTGAEPAGNGCACPEGSEPDSWGTSCVPKEPGRASGGCPAGKNCLTDPANCACTGGEICDPFSELTNPETFCSPRIAYVLVSEDLTDYEYWWLVAKINSIRQYYRDQGYMVRTARVGSLTDVNQRLGNPATRAFAYFGHAHAPSLESSDSVGVKNNLCLDLRRRFMAAGVDAETARKMADERCNNLNLDYAYIHTCFSLDDNTLRDYLVRPGGVYWGKQGKLYAHQGLTESTRP